jgi:cation transport regulator ChaB
MTPEELIAKGPVSNEEAVAGAEATKALAAPEHKGVQDTTTTKNVLAAFDKIVKKEDAVSDESLNKILDEEEQKADDTEDNKEDVSKEVANDKRKSQEAEKVIAEEVKKPALGTARPSANAEDLKSLVPESAQHLFKKMDNSAREFVIAELRRKNKETEELKTKLAVAEQQKSNGKVADSWYEHEEAFILTPEFRELAGTKSQIAAIEKHYREQLVAIKEGEDWFDLVLGKNGEIIQQKQKASSQADALVMTRIAEAASTFRDMEKQEASLIQNWKGNAFNSKAGALKVEDEYFPQYANADEFAKNEDAKALRTIMASAGLQNDRLSGLTTKLYAFAMEHVRKVEELEKQLKSGKSPVTRNGPTGDEINNGTTSKGQPVDPDDKPFNLKGFESYTR